MPEKEVQSHYARIGDDLYANYRRSMRWLYGHLAVNLLVTLAAIATLYDGPLVAQIAVSLALCYCAGSMLQALMNTRTHYRVYLRWKAEFLDE